MKPSLPDETTPPVQLQSRELMCENTVFSVYFDHVSGAGGHDVPRYLSVIPKNITAEGITGVCLLPILAGKLGLIRLFRHPLARWGWEVPRGFVDAGETPEQAAIRELGEETGFTVSMAGVSLLGTIASESGVIMGRTRLFCVQVDHHDVGNTVKASELGHAKLEFFQPADISGLIAAGEIEDACTLATMYRYLLHQEKT